MRVCDIICPTGGPSCTYVLSICTQSSPYHAAAHFARICKFHKIMYVILVFTCLNPRARIWYPLLVCATQTHPLDQFCELLHVAPTHLFWQMHIFFLSDLLVSSPSSPFSPMHVRLFFSHQLPLNWLDDLYELALFLRAYFCAFD